MGKWSESMNSWRRLRNVKTKWKKKAECIDKKQKREKELSCALYLYTSVVSVLYREFFGTLAIWYKNAKKKKKSNAPRNNIAFETKTIEENETWTQNCVQKWTLPTIISIYFLYIICIVYIYLEIACCARAFRDVAAFYTRACARVMSRNVTIHLDVDSNEWITERFEVCTLVDCIWRSYAHCIL